MKIIIKDKASNSIAIKLGLNNKALIYVPLQRTRR